MSEEAQARVTEPWEDRSGLPNFLIIGAMRSGTTSLTRYLRPHPDVFMAPRKELHHFDFNFDEGLDRYREYFAEAGAERAVGEATPNYLYDRDAIPRIADAIPDVKLIAILRNPVDRAYSHYWHNRAVGRETAPFEEALSAEEVRLAPGDPRTRAHWSYVDRGHYVEQLRRVGEFFPRPALVVLLFDDLRDRPGETYRTMCRFLGVADDFGPPELGASVNSFVSFRSRAIRRVARRLPKPARRAVGRLNTKDDPSYPPMEHATRAMLVERFREGNAALAQWLGRDLGAWDE